MLSPWATPLQLPHQGPQLGWLWRDQIQGAATVPTRLWAVLQAYGNSLAKLWFSLLRFSLVLTCCAWFRNQDTEVIRMHNFWFRDEGAQFMAQG